VFEIRDVPCTNLSLNRCLQTKKADMGKKANEQKHDKAST
jgi:hypothetical protein